MPNECEAAYKISSRLAAGLVILIEAVSLAGQQMGMSKADFFNVSRGYHTSPFLGMIHLQAFHFRNLSLWLILHVLTLGVGLTLMALGSPGWVHRATHATTLWSLLPGALVKATSIAG